MSRIKRILFTTMASLGLIAPMAVPAIVSAQDIQDGLCQGANLKLDSSGGCTVDANGNAEDTVNSILTDVINIFSLVVGIVAVIMIIVGGLKYITSGGDSGNVTGAKNTILYAVVGLVVVALAQVIVRYVLTQTGEATT
jgi:cytochrome bd-type quinol oxidase subunit 2